MPRKETISKERFTLYGTPADQRARRFYLDRQTGEIISRRQATERSIAGVTLEERARARRAVEPTPITPILRGKALAKARQAGTAPMPTPPIRLPFKQPRRLAVHYQTTVNGKRERLVSDTQDRWRFKTLEDALRWISALRPKDVVYVKALGRDPFTARESAKFKKRKRGVPTSPRALAVYESQLRWASLTTSQFPAGEVSQHELAMRDKMMFFYDVRYFDVVRTHRAP